MVKNDRFCPDSVQILLKATQTRLGIAADGRHLSHDGESEIFFIAFFIESRLRLDLPEYESPLPHQFQLRSDTAEYVAT